MTKRFLAAIAAVGFAAPAFAQMTAEVRFQPGNYGTMLSGTITGGEYFDYKLGAMAGQEMFAELSVTDGKGHGSVYFNILPPGSDGEAIYIGSMDTDRTAQEQLPESGEYTIRVYLMGNDRDAGNTVGYNIDLSIQ